MKMTANDTRPGDLIELDTPHNTFIAGPTIHASSVVWTDTNGQRHEEDPDTTVTVHRRITLIERDTWITKMIDGSHPTHAWHAATNTPT